MSNDTVSKEIQQAVLQEKDFVHQEQSTKFLDLSQMKEFGEKMLQLRMFFLSAKKFKKMLEVCNQVFGLNVTRKKFVMKRLEKFPRFQNSRITLTLELISDFPI